MKSRIFRNKPEFLRNDFVPIGKWEIPSIVADDLDLNDINLISYSDIKTNDSDINKSKGVHFFIDDYRMEGLYYYPERSFNRLAQYRFLLTPDFSLYMEMPKALQLFNVFKNRWCGANWQAKGKIVIPTISWSDEESFSFCFDGVENGSIVAIGMIGCKHSKERFLKGYYAMLERIQPKAIICFGRPFLEMEGNIIPVDYIKSRRT